MAYARLHVVNGPASEVLRKSGPEYVEAPATNTAEPLCMPQPGIRGVWRFWSTEGPMSAPEATVA